MTHWDKKVLWNKHSGKLMNFGSVDSVDEILTEYNEHIEVDELDEPEYFIYYSICPDCGVKIGIENDGGNGFCVNYASKH